MLNFMSIVYMLACDVTIPVLRISDKASPKLLSAASETS